MFFFNLIILLDLPYDSGQNEIFFVKIKTRVQFSTQAKKLVAVNPKVVAVHIRF